MCERLLIRFQWVAFLSFPVLVTVFLSLFRVFQEVATNLWPLLVNEAALSISRGPEETLGGLSRVQLWRQGGNKDLRQQQIRQASSYNKRYWIKSRRIGIVWNSLLSKYFNP